MDGWVFACLGKFADKSDSLFQRGAICCQFATTICRHGQVTQRTEEEDS